MIVEPIKAASIHEKQLPPHLRRRSSGSSTSYSETVIAQNPPLDNVYKVVAGEDVIANTFGYIDDNKVYVAGVNLSKPAKCFILIDGLANEEVSICFSDVDIDAPDALTGVPILGNNGEMTQVVPSTGFIQIVGDKLSPSTYRMKLRDAKWFDL